jgi:hypothetical protein
MRVIDLLSVTKAISRIGSPRRGQESGKTCIGAPDRGTPWPWLSSPFRSRAPMRTWVSREEPVLSLSKGHPRGPTDASTVASGVISPGRQEPQFLHTLSFLRSSHRLRPPRIRPINGVGRRVPSHHQSRKANGSPLGVPADFGDRPAEYWYGGFRSLFSPSGVGAFERNPQAADFQPLYSWSYARTDHFWTASKLCGTMRYCRGGFGIES